MRSVLYKCHWPYRNILKNNCVLPTLLWPYWSALTTNVYFVRTVFPKILSGPKQHIVDSCSDLLAVDWWMGPSVAGFHSWVELFFFVVPYRKSETVSLRILCVL
jgi:hypothetical protein